jgi:polar amino acid transport system substrate-binding protein
MNNKPMAINEKIDSKSLKYFLKCWGTAFSMLVMSQNLVYGGSNPKQATVKQTSAQVKPHPTPATETAKPTPSPTQQDKPPFYFVNKEGKLVGNDPELAEEIAKGIDPSLKVRYVRTAQTFDEIIQQVHQGQADIAISKISYTIQRSKRVLYAKKPYIQLYNAFIVNRSAPSSLSLAELFDEHSRYSLCAIKGSAQVKTAQGLFPKVKLLELPTAEDTVAALRSEKCIASIRDNNEVRKILLSDPKLNLRYKAVILNGEPDSIYIVTDPAKPKLALFIDQLLENNPKYIKTLNDIYSKYEDQLR